jgi:hypothetical protein
MGEDLQAAWQATAPKPPNPNRKLVILASALLVFIVGAIGLGVGLSASRHSTGSASSPGASAPSSSSSQSTKVGHLVVTGQPVDVSISSVDHEYINYNPERHNDSDRTYTDVMLSVTNKGNAVVNLAPALHLQVTYASSFARVAQISSGQIMPGNTVQLKSHTTFDGHPGSVTSIQIAVDAAFGTGTVTLPVNDAPLPGTPGGTVDPTPDNAPNDPVPASMPAADPTPAPVPSSPAPGSAAYNPPGYNNGSGSSGTGKQYAVTTNTILRSGPFTSTSQLDTVPQGTMVSVECKASGETVNGTWGPDSNWDRVTYNGHTGYLTDEWVDTKTDETSILAC